MPKFRALLIPSELYHWTVTIELADTNWSRTDIIIAHDPNEALELMKKKHAYKTYPEIEGKNFNCTRLNRRAKLKTEN